MILATGKQTGLAQFGTDAVWLPESHSHRGFSPVDHSELLFRNRFNGFARDLEGYQHGKPLKRLGTCEGVFDHRAKAAV
jgi:hypothetical protein